MKTCDELKPRSSKIIMIILFFFKWGFRSWTPKFKGNDPHFLFFCFSLPNFYSGEIFQPQHWTSIHDVDCPLASRPVKLKMFYIVLMQIAPAKVIIYNVWCIKNRTKLSNVLLLSLVRILMHQTLSPAVSQFYGTKEEFRLVLGRFGSTENFGLGRKVCNF